MSFPLSSKRTTINSPLGGSNAPWRTNRPNSNPLGNSPPRSATDTASMWHTLDDNPRITPPLNTEAVNINTGPNTTNTLHISPNVGASPPSTQTPNQPPITPEVISSPADTGEIQLQNFATPDSQYISNFVNQVLLRRKEFSHVRQEISQSTEDHRPTTIARPHTSYNDFLRAHGWTPSPECPFSLDVSFPKEDSAQTNVNAEESKTTDNNNEQSVTTVRQERSTTVAPTDHKTNEGTPKIKTPSLIGSNENGLHMSWVDHVAIQQRNNDLRKQGHSMFPDQMVGFNDDGMSVDKLVNERSKWGSRVTGEQPLDTNMPLPPSGPTDNPNHYVPPPPSDPPANNNTGDQQQSMHVATGGPPDDPGDDSDNNHSDHNSHHSYCRKQTPWEIDSVDDLPESNSETISLSEKSWADGLFQTQGSSQNNKDNKNK
ncbi:hypothetical protein EV360DRAFT_89762 [Lentinula raphanica]|nr:hypothetical protein EV360DRAFT_89762 [Lentinula raphanica]